MAFCDVMYGNVGEVTRVRELLDPQHTLSRSSALIQIALGYPLPIASCELKTPCVLAGYAVSTPGVVRSGASLVEAMCDPVKGLEEQNDSI